MGLFKFWHWSSAVIKQQARDWEVVGSIPQALCCALEQDTLSSACTNCQNLEVLGLPIFFIWKSSSSIFLLTSHLWNKTAIFKLNKQNSFWNSGEVDKSLSLIVLHVFIGDNPVLVWILY